MGIYKSAVINNNAEKFIKTRSLWLFSKSFIYIPTFIDGEILEIKNAEDNVVAYGYFNSKSNILCRILSFENDPINELELNIKRAFTLRKSLFKKKETDCYRLINSEGDFIPGLIVDYYNNNLVMQVSTAGIEKLKPHIIDLLIKILKPVSIFEKSTNSSRKIEGLEKINVQIYGHTPDKVEVTENKIKYFIDIKKGHKTGMYLDQREARSLISKIAKSKRVLNLFCYNGGFSLNAYKAGARSITSVDISKEAIDQCMQNYALNSFSTKNSEFIISNVLDYIKDINTSIYDLVIIDPPAFAKSVKDIKPALKAYEKLNSTIFKNAKSNTLILSSSCSYHISYESFLDIIKNSALKANKSIKIVKIFKNSFDHTQNPFNPGNEYLKTILLEII